MENQSQHVMQQQMQEHHDEMQGQHDQVQNQQQFIEHGQVQGHEGQMEMNPNAYYGQPTLSDEIQKVLYQQYVAQMSQPGVVMNPQMIHAYTNQYRLPNSEVQVEEEPIYVNAKQYHRILVRREQRAKLERQNKLVKQRRPFLHQSRHNHAKGRKRGPNGRFMSKKEREKYEKELALNGGVVNTSITESGTNSQSNSATSTPDHKSEKKKRGRKKGSKQTMDQAVEATVSQLQEQTQTPTKETPQK